MFDHYQINIPFHSWIMSFLTWMHSLPNVISDTLVEYQYIRYQCIASSMFIIATSIFTALYVTAVSRLGVVPSVVCTKQVDLTEVVGLHELHLPSPEFVHQELSRWKERYVFRCNYGIYRHITIQIVHTRSLLIVFPHAY